jgi:hypothetical protein
MLARTNVHRSRSACRHWNRSSRTVNAKSARQAALDGTSCHEDCPEGAATTPDFVALCVTDTTNQARRRTTNADVILPARIPSRRAMDVRPSRRIAGRACVQTTLFSTRNKDRIPILPTQSARSMTRRIAKT